MSQSNLPPGVTNRMIDEAAGADRPCDVCGQSVDGCVCPECPKCGVVGDPNCYRPACNCGPVKHWECNAGCRNSGHGLVRTQMQIDSLREAEARWAADAEAEAAWWAKHAPPEDEPSREG